ncbi:uncharacterized protein LOC117319488 [Pecten maximus]|uniref:uncharacterized protein LOC117319488 n=1 Tax=Pecten maximus TaxID=6579 RepID=UPI0014588D04|nr:uncharacterized protein LOC117319488 [Pecten maximus]
MVYGSGRLRKPLSFGMCSVLSAVFGLFIYTVLTYSEYIKPISMYSYVPSQDSTLLSVFSAVIDIEDEHKVTLNVWDGTRDMDYKCCILISNAKLVQVLAKPLDSAYEENVISARQYRCSFSSLKGHVISVAMIPASKTCTMSEQFTNVMFPSRPKIVNSFVIYSVLTQEVRPIQLIEWLEYYKSTGVDKIYLVLQLPYAQLMTVLSYYSRNDFLEIKELPFPLPGRSQDTVDRSFMTTMDDLIQRQLDQDKLVGTFHCREYLRGYGYAANIDVNEFILTEKWRVLFYFLEETFEKTYPDAAAVKLRYVQDSHYKSNFKGKNDTERIKYKIIYIPGHVEPTRSDLVIPHTNYHVYTLPEYNGAVYHVGQCSAMWIICIRNRSPSTMKLYRSRTELERKCFAVATKLYLSAYNFKPRY